MFHNIIKKYFIRVLLLSIIVSSPVLSEQVPLSNKKNSKDVLNNSNSKKDSKDQKTLQDSKKNTSKNSTQTGKGDLNKNDKSSGIDENQKKEISMPEEKEHPLLGRAEKHFFNKRYHIALKLLKKILEQNPENTTAYLYSGDIYLIQHNYGLAEEQFQIARELSKNPAREWFRLGQTRLLRKDSRGALKAFEKSLKSKPDMFENLFYIGLVNYHLLRNKEKTITAWKSFLKNKPDDPQAEKIKKALEILAKKDFVFPALETNPCIQIPTNKDSRVPYKPAGNEKEKTNNKTESIMEVDDL